MRDAGEKRAGNQPLEGATTPCGREAGCLVECECFHVHGPRARGAQRRRSQPASVITTIYYHRDNEAGERACRRKTKLCKNIK